MELIEVKCDSYGKDIYVYDSHVREHMYCTLRCMDITENLEHIGN